MTNVCLNELVFCHYALADTPESVIFTNDHSEIVPVSFDASKDKFFWAKVHEDLRCIDQN